MTQSSVCARNFAIVRKSSHRRFNLIYAHSLVTRQAPELSPCPSLFSKWSLAPLGPPHPWLPLLNVNTGFVTQGSEHKVETQAYSLCCSISDVHSAVFGQTPPEVLFCVPLQFRGPQHLLSHLYFTRFSPVPWSLCYVFPTFLTYSHSTHTI